EKRPSVGEVHRACVGTFELHVVQEYGAAVRRYLEGSLAYDAKTHILEQWDAPGQRQWRGVVIDFEIGMSVSSPFLAMKGDGDRGVGSYTDHAPGIRQGDAR